MKKTKNTAQKIIVILAVGIGALFISLFLLINFAFPTRYSDSIVEASKKYDIDASLIRAVIWVESKYKKDAVSSKGAVGLMQILPSTAEFVAELAGYDNFDHNSLGDENINIDLGVFYLHYLFQKFQTPDAVLAAYNAGEGNVKEWQQQGITTIPFKETRDYVKRVLFVKNIYDFKSR